MPSFRLLLFYLTILTGSVPAIQIDNVTERDREETYHLFPWYRDHHREPINVLSIDGGGIRGIIPAVFLEQLEHDIGTPICEIFDLVAGTSTGAILSMGLLTPMGDTNRHRSAREMVGIYKTLSATIFPPKSNGIFSGFTDLFSRYKYDPIPLENSLVNYFGNQRLSDVVVPTVITSVDANFNNIRLFRNYRSMWNRHENFFVRDVLRSTSAAPTYFPMSTIYSTGPNRQQFQLVDGGMAANNPSVIALAEAYRIFGTTRRINLISLGTGKEAQIINPIENMYIYRAKPTIDMMFSAQSNATDQVIDDLSEDARRGITYHRFELPIPQNLTPMDLACNVENLSRMTIRHLNGPGRSQYRQVRLDLVNALNQR